MTTWSSSVILLHASASNVARSGTKEQCWRRGIYRVVCMWKKLRRAQVSIVLGFGLTFYFSVLLAEAYSGTVLLVLLFVCGYFSMYLRRATFRVQEGSRYHTPTYNTCGRSLVHFKCWHATTAVRTIAEKHTGLDPNSKLCGRAMLAAHPFWYAWCIRISNVHEAM